MSDKENFTTFAPVKQERRIIAYKHYFAEFMESLTPAEQKKVVYVLDMLKSQQRINAKFVKLIRDGLYELRVESGGNIYRVFFIFDDGNIVILFNGFPILGLILGFVITTIMQSSSVSVGILPRQAARPPRASGAP